MKNCNLPRTRYARLPLAILVASALSAGVLPASAEKKRDASQDAAQDEAAANPLTGTAVMAVVSLASQRVTLYDAQGGKLRSPVSSGQTDYETPVGIYSVLQKKEEHYSNIYDDAEMPFMQRITWSGIALHAGQLPGYPASHGCVRMPRNFAEQIFPLTKRGMRVIVARDDVAPVAVSHPLLFQPKPISGGGEVAVATPTAYYPASSDEDSIHPLLPDVQNWPARQKLLESLKPDAAAKSQVAETATEHAKTLQDALKKTTLENNKAMKKVRAAEAAKKKAEAKVARIDKWLASAKAPKEIKSAEDAKAKAATALTAADADLAAANAAAKPAIDAIAKATEEANAAEAARLAAVNAAKEAERKMLPVSVFVSLKTQRLYIRQGNEPVLDVPVTIQNPDQPIGTHIFTAVDYADGGNEMRWNAVSLARSTGATETDWSRDDDDGWGWNADGMRKKKRKVASNAPTPPTDLSAATAALDRVTMPPEIVAQVSASAWPGSSLIISDEPMHKETGKATDFIVLISGEPQGGIKKRPKPPADFYPYDDYYYSYRDDRRDDRRRYRGNPKFFWW
jgi:hypothetical protein